MKNFCITNCFLFLILLSSQAQFVETVANHPKIVDGLYVDHQGNVYTTSGGLVNGVEIGEYNVQTSIYNPNYATGFSGPINISSYQDSLFVISNYDNGTVYSYNRNSGEINTLASGLDGPAGITIDLNDNIYVTSFGVPPTYSGHIIYKITPAANTYNYIDSTALLRPQAICFNHQNELVVHSNEVLYKVNPVDSTLQAWVNLGFEVGNMTLRSQDSCIYAAAGGNTDQIIKITTEGAVSTFSGSTGGYQDGLINTAQFSNPLGIAFSPTEDTLYVSEAGGANRLRRIVMNSPTSIKETYLDQFEIFPNPTEDFVTIQNKNDEGLNVEVYNSSGRLMTSMLDNSKEICINLHSFSKGVYIIRIIAEDEEVMKKVVKW